MLGIRPRSLEMLLLTAAMQIVAASALADWEPGELSFSNPASQGKFGRSVAVDRDIVVVGATYGNGFNGLAYVYRYDGAISDLFGETVSVSGDTVAIGALGSDYSGPCKNSGAD